MFRRFKRRFEYRNEAGEKIVVPFNWAGELPAEVAKAADKAGATVPPQRTAQATEQPASEDDNAPSREDQIRAAIETLKPDDYAADGKPNVGPLNAAMPKGLERVTAEERDAFWAQNAPPAE